MKYKDLKNGVLYKYNIKWATIFKKWDKNFNSKDIFLNKYFNKKIYTIEF